MKQSYVQIVLPDGSTKLVPKEELRPVRSSPVAPAIIGDLNPYESIIDGSIIDGRAQHRQHLAAHGYEEVGSEQPAWMKEKKYVESHGGTYERPKPDLEGGQGVHFEWQDL